MNKKPPPKPKRYEMIVAKVRPELKALAGSMADDMEVPLGELVAIILAEKFGRPDLAEIPRKRGGRPRKDIDLS